MIKMSYNVDQQMLRSSVMMPNEPASKLTRILPNRNRKLVVLWRIENGKEQDTRLRWRT